jgi:hypothetical protein
MHVTGARPRRYSRDKTLSSLTDQLTERAEHYRSAGDCLAADELDAARQHILIVTTGRPKQGSA